VEVSAGIVSKNDLFWSTFYIVECETIMLPRQARDKSRDNSKRRWFSRSTPLVSSTTTAAAAALLPLLHSHCSSTTTCTWCTSPCRHRTRTLQRRLPSRMLHTQTRQTSRVRFTIPWFGLRCEKRHFLRHLYLNASFYQDRLGTNTGKVEWRFPQDDCLGNLTAALKSTGMWKDTLVVVTSDNGGPMYRSERLFRAILNYKGSFYQDRLGTNIGKALKRGRFLTATMLRTTTP
jgi:hypothetical protein